MRVRFANEELELLFLIPLSEIRGKQKFSTDVIKQYKKKIQLLNAITRVEQLKQHKGLNFEYLKGLRKGTCSIRLNIQYRLIFSFTDEQTVQVILINEISKHYE